MVDLAERSDNNEAEEEQELPDVRNDPVPEDGEEEANP